MRDGCWICKKWEEHFYWDHFEESNFRFMKVMNGDFTQKMEFPQKFAKNFRVELIDVVALEAPNGKLWEIGLCKEQDDRFYFDGGWKEFVEANEIQEDNSLVFEYAGDSAFRVRIFDKTGCVRASSNLINNGRTKQKNVDQTMKNFQNSHPSKIACDDLPLRLHEQATDNRSAYSGRVMEDEENGMGKVKDDGRIRSSSRLCKRKVSDLNSSSESERKIDVRNSQETVELLELKFASKQGSCFFVKLITKCHISASPFMAIPNKFASKHIPQKPRGIYIFNQSNKKWYVNCSWSKSSWGFRGSSLYKLGQENDFQKDDACVFELKERSERVVMELSIVRAKEVYSILKKSCL